MSVQVNARTAKMVAAAICAYVQLTRAKKLSVTNKRGGVKMTSLSESDATVM
jgi:hypothetical protein